MHIKKKLSSRRDYKMQWFGLCVFFQYKQKKISS